MRLLKHSWGAALVALVLSSQAFAADELVVYSGRSDKFVRPVFVEFTDRTGIEIVLHSASSTALLNKLRIEGEHTPADLYISNDAGNLQIGADLGLFHSVPQEIAEVIPVNRRGPDNTWIGLSARARVLVVNTVSGPEFVKSVFDLADPRLAGRLGITNSTNESYLAGATVYMLKAGEARTRAWLEGMKENVDGEVFNKHSRIVDAVAVGKKDIGLVNHYYIFRHLDQAPDAPIRILLPDQGPAGMGVAWNVAGIAISKHSKQKGAAEQLVKFLVSEEGQRIFAEVNREYPTRRGVPAAEEVPPADSYKVADIPMAELGRKRDETIDLIEAVGMP